MTRIVRVVGLAMLVALPWGFVALGTGKPVAVSFDPVNGATSVATNKELVLAFDRNVFPRFTGTITGNTVTVHRSDATVLASFYSFGGGFHRFNPATEEFEAVGTNVIRTEGVSLIINLSGDGGNDFEPGTTYYVTIGNRAIYSTPTSSPSGNAFDGFTGNNTWRFTTASAIPPPAIVDASRLPAPGATGVSVNPVITAQFTEPVQWGTDGLFRLHRASDNVVAATFTPGQVGTSISADQLSISFSATTLASGTEYYVTMTNDFVRSLANVPFAGISDPAYWRFTTAAAMPAWGIGYPRVINQDANGFTFLGQTDQNADVFFVVTSTGLSAPTPEQVASGLDGTGQPARISFGGSMVANIEFAHTQGFNIHTQLGNHYFLYAVARSGGNFGLVVRLDIDRIAPVLEPALTFPVNGYRLVQLNDTIRLGFSEPVFNFANPGTTPVTASNFQLLHNNNPVAFTLVTGVGGTATLVPSVLVENGSYAVRILNIADQSGNLAADATLNFETDKNNIWSGGGNGSVWTDQQNWLDGNLVAGKSVSIPAGLVNYPEISTGTVDVHNLTIAPGAFLRQTGGTLNVSGRFTLQSSTSHNASYLPAGGVLNVNAQSVRVEQVVSYSNRTYSVSSPVAGATPANIGVTNGMFRWDNPSATWAPVTGTMEPGVGYIARSTRHLVFSGSFNRDIVTVPVQYSALGFGWNMLGNPYPAAIDWSLVQANHAEIDNSLWVWQLANTVYGVYNGETGIGVNFPPDSNPRVIPRNHSFFVRVKQGIASSSVTFTPAAMVPNTTSYLKSSRGGNFENIKIAGKSGGGLTDEIAIVFVGNASGSFDRFDSQKMFSRASNMIELYTLADNTRLAINGLPWETDTLLPLGFSVRGAGTYTISLSANNSNGKDVILYDGNNPVANLTMGETHTFTVGAATENHERFALRLKGLPTSIVPGSTLSPGLNILAHVNQGDVFLAGSGVVTGAGYYMHDISGRLVASGVIDSAGHYHVGRFNKGVYVIRVIPGGGNEAMEQKLVVY